MRYGSLFAGIGGFDLGLGRIGMECAWQVEIDPYCRKVLEKHWPNVRRFKDVKECGKENLGPVDLICGGFPCQPHSVAGKRKGAEDDRNLWPEFSRIIAELRPRYILAENVPGIVSTYLDTVLSDLESQGYATATLNLPACAFDAPHRRERIFVVAYASSQQDNTKHERDNRCSKQSRERIAAGAKAARQTYGQTDNDCLSGCGKDVANADCEYRKKHERRHQLEEEVRERSLGRSYQSRGGQWAVEPNVGRGLDGFPVWLERHIGRGMSYEESARAIKILRKLWDRDVAETLWQTIGGFDRVQKSEILFSVVRQYQKDPDKTRIFLESEEALEGFVRSLWNQEKITGSSHRSKNTKQSVGEHPNSVQTLSRLLAFNGEKDWSVSSWEDGIPRVATGIPSRVDRLRCLGNAVVPQVAEWIGRKILESAD